jgi:hypothetical protein
MFNVKGEGYDLEVNIMFNLKISVIIYGRGLMIRFKVMFSPYFYH